MQKWTLLATLTALSVALSSIGYADTSTQTVSKAPTKPVYKRHNKLHHHLQVHQPETMTVEKKGTPPTLADTFLKHMSGNFDLTTNYMFRGVSQTNNLPAAQGGFTYKTDQGIYFNLWGSNVNFSDPQGYTATAEFDYVLGITNSIGDNFTYDLNIDRYNYPKANAASYNELILNLTWKILTYQGGYSTNAYGSHGNGIYNNLGFNIPVAPRYAYFDDVYVSGGFGHYDLPSSLGSYNDYNLAISKKLDKYTFAIQWTSTNGGFNTPVSQENSHILGTVTATF